MRRGRWAGRLGAVAAVVAAVLGTAAPTGAGHIRLDVVTGAPPPAWTRVTCASRPPSPGQRWAVPLRIVRQVSIGGSETVVPEVPVCLAGRGPYLFVVDTGADQSLVDAGLAGRLGLPRIGAAPVQSGGCTSETGEVTMSRWSVGPVPLAAQTVLDSPTAAMSGTEGLIGADVLSRFGTVRIDYSASLLVAAGPSGPVLGASVAAPTAGRPHVVRALLTGNAWVAVPLGVLVEGPGVTPTVSVTLGRNGPFAFIVDTGTAQSVVSSGADAALAPTGLDVATGSIGCTQAHDPVVHSGRWSVAGWPLHPQLLIELDLGGSETEGLLGSDQLSTFGSAVVDFSQGWLLLARQ